jgi:hypothetical protein
MSPIAVRISWNACDGLHAPYRLDRAGDRAGARLGSARVRERALHLHGDVEPAAVAERHPHALPGLQDRELRRGVEHAQDRLGARVRAAALVVERPVEPTAQFGADVAQELEHGQHHGLVGLGLADALGLDAAVAQRGLERPLHQVVVLGHRVALDQQRAVERARARAQHEVVARGVDQLAGAERLQSRAHDLLHVPLELRMVGLHQRVEAGFDRVRDAGELDQRREQELAVECAVHGRGGIEKPLGGHGAGSSCGRTSAMQRSSWPRWSSSAKRRIGRLQPAST